MRGSGDAAFLPLEDTNTCLPNTANLDVFFQQAYDYYLGKGFWNILLARVLNILTLFFVVSICTVFFVYVDYDILLKGGSFEDSMRNRSMPGFWVFVLVITAIAWAAQVLLSAWEIKKTWEIRNYFHQVLDINDDTLQTMKWTDVVARLCQISRLNIQKDYVSPLDVVQQIMRKKNFLIAMVNGRVLDMNIRVPYMTNTGFLTKTFEWALSFCVFQFVFDGSRVRGSFKTASRHAGLAMSLRRRFRLWGFGMLLLSPIVFVALFVYYLLRYGEELRSSPGMLATRRWSPSARWSFREFNELPHVFEKRLKLAEAPATKYVDSFKSAPVVIISRFVALVGSCLILILVVLAFFNPSVLLVSTLWGRTGVWYLTILASTVAVARSILPDEYSLMDHEKVLQEVNEHVHDIPVEWAGRCHTSAVHEQFSQWFELRLISFAREILSVLFTPLILIFWMPDRSDDIVSFFSRFAVESPGIHGHICALADPALLDRHGDSVYGAPSSAAPHLRARNGKMEKSFVNFKAQHPEWKVPDAGARLLHNLTSVLDVHGSVLSEDLQRSAVLSPEFQSGTMTRPPAPESAALELNRLHRAFFTQSVLRNSHVGFGESPLPETEEIFTVPGGEHGAPSDVFDPEAGESLFSVVSHDDDTDESDDAPAFSAVSGGADL